MKSFDNISNLLWKTKSVPISSEKFRLEFATSDDDDEDDDDDDDDDLSTRRLEVVFVADANADVDANDVDVFIYHDVLKKIQMRKNNRVANNVTQGPHKLDSDLLMTQSVLILSLSAHLAGKINTKQVA